MSNRQNHTTEKSSDYGSAIKESKRLRGQLKDVNSKLGKCPWELSFKGECVNVMWYFETTEAFRVDLTIFWRYLMSFRLSN